jgi:magnesium transporter
MEDIKVDISVEEEIISLLNSNDNQLDFSSEFSKYHHYEIARILTELSIEKQKQLFTYLSEEKIIQIFEELPPETAYEVLKEYENLFIKKIFNGMESDDLADIIDIVKDSEEQITLLSLVNPKKRSVIKSLLNFEKDMVGSIMNNEYVFINKDFTVKKAIDKVVFLAPDIEFIHNIYIIDDDNHLIGAMSLKELISAGYDKSQLIEDLMATNLIYVTPSEEIENAIEIMKNYDFLLLPVVDKSQKMLGIISFDDILDALNESSDEDYSRLAALTEVDISETETVLMSLKKRIPWLAILLLINLITSSIIIGFESQLTLLPTLAIFLPLILSMAGNSGTQSLGVIIRFFATNQLDNKKAIIKHIINEFLTGLVNGVIIAAALFIMVIVFNLIKGEAFNLGLNFALTVAISINIALIVATMAGTLVPLLINALKIDPAIASGPFITTVNDILSLLIYFGIASLLIPVLA